MAKLVWSNLAACELESIFKYIAKDSQRYAQAEIQAIYSKITMLKTQPLIGVMVKEYGKPNIREIIYSHYRIIYQIIDEQTILILTIHNCYKFFHASN